MIEDIHEPVELFKSIFKEAHARNTSDFFEDLVRKSGVDEQANIKTVQELRALESQVDHVSTVSKTWKVLRVLMIVAGIVLAIYLATEYNAYWIMVPAGITAFAVYKLNQKIREIEDQLRRQQELRDAKLKEAWAQMAPLNRLYDWDILAKLVQRTVPRLELDPYFTNERLNELRKTYGWNDAFNEGRSIVVAHSGVLNGNPFVLAQTLNHWMGTKTYEGSLNISWTEQVRDSEGRWTTVTRHQTLRASVVKPFPEYGNRPIIIYGNEAAPDLTFSRNPSKLSKLEDGFINNWRKNRAVKKLEAKAREINDGKGFAVMANREFDALFGAVDRDHEVQFRLLFTPLAQQEIVKLLKDKEVGFGDTFHFHKFRMLNLVEPLHMAKTEISSDPALFHAYELAHARVNFNSYHNDFFKSFYFGIAPILAIPIYQQHRSHADIYKHVYGNGSCFWEHESIAYYFGEKRFQHPECVTRSILKTEPLAAEDGTQTIRVTASGYKGINRVDYVSVHGGDGRYHDVPVHWLEYIGVQCKSDMILSESASPNTGADTREPDGNGSAVWQKKFKEKGFEPRNAIMRRSIVAALFTNR